MKCRMCGHTFDDEWWTRGLKRHWLYTDTLKPIDEDYWNGEDADPVEFSLLYPCKAKLFCSDCWHWKIDKNSNYWRYRPIQSDEEIASGIAKALEVAAKKIAENGFFSRCERMGGNYGYGVGRCRHDAKVILDDGHKVCGHCFNAVKEGKKVSFVDLDCGSDEPPSMKYARLLLAEIYP